MAGGENSLQLHLLSSVHPVACSHLHKPSHSGLRFIRTQTHTLTDLVVWFQDTLLHDLPEVWVLHGCRHPLFVIYLLVDCKKKKNKQMREIYHDSTMHSKFINKRQKKNSCQLIVAKMTCLQFNVTVQRRSYQMFMFSKSRV